MEKDPEIDKLEAKLREAWKKTPAPLVPENWQDKVMKAVNEEAEPGLNHRFQKILWRCAVLTAGAACLLFLLIPDDMLRPTSELFRLIMLDPAGFLTNLPFDF